MNFTARDWSQTFEATKKRIQYCKSQGKDISSIEYNALQNSLKTLDAQLKTMENCSLEFEMYPSELARRRVLLENAQNLLTSGAINKQVLIQQSPSSPNSNAVHNPLNTSTSGLAMRQQHIIQAQDAMLGEISVGVDKLHNQAQTIGEEAKTQSRLLESLEQETDTATTGLQVQTDHVNAIKEKSTACKLYVCIVVEFVLLLLFTILGFMEGNL
jgi:hypothetical protein